MKLDPIISESQLRKALCCIVTTHDQIMTSYECISIAGTHIHLSSESRGIADENGTTRKAGSVSSRFTGATRHRIKDRLHVKPTRFNRFSISTERVHKSGRPIPSRNDIDSAGSGTSNRIIKNDIIRSQQSQGSWSSCRRIRIPFNLVVYRDITWIRSTEISCYDDIVPSIKAIRKSHVINNGSTRSTTTDRHVSGIQKKCPAQAVIGREIYNTIKTKVALS